MGTEPSSPHCHFDKSRAAKSHSPMVCSIATGDLSTQRFNSPEVFIPIPPCPSARDDGGGRQHTVISKGQMTETPTRHFVISTAAKRSGEISRRKWQKRCLPLVISTKAQQSSKISLPHGTRAWRQAARHHRAIIKGAVGNDFHFPQPLLSVSRYLISVPDAASRFPCRSFRCSRP